MCVSQSFFWSSGKGERSTHSSISFSARRTPGKCLRSNLHFHWKNPRRCSGVHFNEFMNRCPRFARKRNANWGVKRTREYDEFGGQELNRASSPTSSPCAFSI